MSTEIDDLLALSDAADDTKTCASAVWHLRNELAALGCTVDISWHAAADAQRRVEHAYLEIYEAVRRQAAESLK